MLLRRQTLGVIKMGKNHSTLFDFAIDMLMSERGPASHWQDEELAEA